jgi:hypothetical protein
VRVLSTVYVSEARANQAEQAAKLLAALADGMDALVVGHEAVAALRHRPIDLLAGNPPDVVPERDIGRDPKCHGSVTYP